MQNKCLTSNVSGTELGVSPGHVIPRENFGSDGIGFRQRSKDGRSPRLGKSWDPQVPVQAFDKDGIEKASLLFQPTFQGSHLTQRGCDLCFSLSSRTRA